ncbi:hypothetical protein ENSA5_60860 [Enhygromyxa salina]|uniref:Uncharacterized protein n=1 Tax=Enhygromyxa salina TaxID=215803 RepID=A0A2S9XD95_9BACT|nr:hypothetical protein [Enhygromyxa salina]PRP90836.1 hypothetical protein ENSA5_60860 [Enhygromyxa salina]
MPKSTSAPPCASGATEVTSERRLAPLGWPYVAVGSSGAAPGSTQLRANFGQILARRVIGGFGLMLGASAGLFVGGLAAVLLAALLHPFVPHLAELALLSITLFSLAAGAVIGRRVLQRETFE